MSNSFWDVTDNFLPGHSRSQSSLKKGGEGLSDARRKIVGFGFRRRTLKSPKLHFENSFQSRFLIRSNPISRPWNLESATSITPTMVFHFILPFILIPFYSHFKYWFCIRSSPGWVGPNWRGGATVRSVNNPTAARADFEQHRPAIPAHRREREGAEIFEDNYEPLYQGHAEDWKRNAAQGERWESHQERSWTVRADS